MSYFLGDFKDIPVEMKRGVMSEHYSCLKNHDFLAWVSFEVIDGVQRLPLIPCPECGLLSNMKARIEDEE